jgi:hypothetical protein
LLAASCFKWPKCDAFEVQEQPEGSTYSLLIYHVKSIQALASPQGNDNMQRGVSLHRETPIPGKNLEHMSRKTSGTSLSHLSVGSIAEQDEEEETEIRDSATSLVTFVQFLSGR